MKDNYTYPVILDYKEKGYINISFPDFDYATTCVKNGRDFVEAAQDLLVLLVADKEESGKELPISGGAVYELKEGQKEAYINIWMPYHRTKIKEVYVKKTLTIPLWLDVLAKENNINFSATLVEGLKTKLGLTTH